MSSNRSTTYLIVGIILIGMNALAFAPYVSQATLDTVHEAVESGYDESSDFEDDDSWGMSTSERAYFAHSITNPSDVVDGTAAPEFEKLGPFIYNVTTYNDLLDWDADNGTMTYSSYDVFEWCETCTHEGEASVSGDTSITNVNILWNTQRIAGISTGIEYGEQFAKAGFTKNMMTYDMMYLAPSMDTADQISAIAAGAVIAIDAQTGGQLDALTVAGMADAMVLDGFFASWNATLDDATRAALGADAMSPNFASSAGSILNSAVDSTSGVCMALTCDYGPWMVAAWGEPSSVITPLRADLLGYGTADPAEMALMDWAIYAGAASMMQDNGAGIPPELATDNAHRVEVLTGYSFPADDLEYFLFGTNAATGYPAGMLAEQDLSGIPLYGVVLSLLPLTASPPDYMGYIQEYNIPGILTMQTVAGWSSDWQLAESHFPLRILNPAASGTMDADTWWKMSFGGEEPLAGGNIAVGLNRALPGGEGASLSLDKVDEILYDGPYALTNSEVATMFMYGELSGMTFPMVRTTTSLTSGYSTPGEGGLQTPWDDAHVANMYGISESDASLLRSWVNDLMFESVVGLLLNFQYGAGPLTTQSVSNWLYGWSDPVLVGLYGAENSWVSLETNMTYYGSDGLSTGDYSVYEETTTAQGYDTDGDGGRDITPGLRVAEGYLNSDTGEVYAMSEHMPWRSPAAETATYGLLTANVGNDFTDQTNAFGSMARGNSDETQKINLVGYAMAETSVEGEVEFKGIPMIHHSVALDPATNQIQAKLIGSGTVVDVLPGALPVYFESNVDIYFEEITGIAMYGKSTSTFHLDLRGPGMLNPEIGVDTHPVFEIHTASEISDDDAESFVSAVVDNQGLMFWTDFGTGADGSTDDVADFVAVALYLVAFYLIFIGARGMREARSGEE